MDDLKEIYNYAFDSKFWHKFSANGGDISVKNKEIENQQGAAIKEKVKLCTPASSFQSFSMQTMWGCKFASEG